METAIPWGAWAFLKSGSLPMLVVEVYPGLRTLAWRDLDGAHETTLPVVVLTLDQPPHAQGGAHG